jgi:hypothetical protein
MLELFMGNAGIGLAALHAGDLDLAVDDGRGRRGLQAAGEHRDVATCNRHGRRKVGREPRFRDRRGYPRLRPDTG